MDKNIITQRRALVSFKRRKVLSTSFDLIPDAVFAIDTLGKVFLWNKSMEVMTGIAKSEIIGKGDYTHALYFYGSRRPMLADLVLSPDPHYEVKYSSFVRQGDTSQIEVYVPEAYSGKGAHVWSKAAALYSKRGELIGAIQTISDMTPWVEQHAKLEALNLEFHATNQELAATNEQLTAIEEELRQQYEDVLEARAALEVSNQRLGDIIEYLPDATFVLDKDKRVVAWNKEMEVMTNISKSQVLGTTDYAIALYGSPRPVLVDYLGKSEEEVRKQYATEFRHMEQQVIYNEGFMRRIYGGKGAYLSVMAASLLDRNGHAVGAIESLRDISVSRENQQALRDNEALLREITNHMRDIVCKVSPDGLVKYVSPSLTNMSGYTPEEMLGKHFSNFVHSDDMPALLAGYRQLKDGANEVKLEFRANHLHGLYRYVESMGSPVRDELGAITGIVYVIRDVTERKLMEQRLRYLGLHDHLTDTYNRAFFEEQLLHMGQPIFFPLAVITCDIDGLKLVNDTLGHHAGDLLLQTAATTIKRMLKKEDILARVGGDELAVIVPHTSEAAARRLCADIRQAVIDYNQVHPKLPLSMSIGHAYGSEVAPLHRLFEAADNSMYREKLHRQQSTRSAVVHTLMLALEARDFITEGHADRLQSLVARLAERLALPERTITDLRLLAQFHDIGKVGVPDSILFKPAKLTPSEQLEMQRHCEIGNRIAQASPDLLPISDWILKHHEWWNGSGYPLGLNGEDIPLECRIISIADAYDAMTNDRPYRKALTTEEAITELKRGAGQQFDPHLVAEFLAVLAV